MKNNTLNVILMATAGALWVADASADTIFEAMSNAYNTNPILHAERAGSGAANEDAAAARSGFRPTVAVGANYRDTHAKTTGTRTTDGYTKGYNGTIKQSLFSGFQTYNAVKAADRAAKAGIDIKSNDNTVIIPTDIDLLTTFILKSSILNYIEYVRTKIILFFYCRVLKMFKL